MPLVLNGTTGVQDNSGAFVLGTAVASTSGTSIDFTSIPSWVKRVTVSFNGVSTNGTSNLLIQVGSGSVDTSGYASTSSGMINAANYTPQNSTAGFIMVSAQTTNTASGHMVLTAMGGNIWISSHTGKSDTNLVFYGGGNKSALSGALDRVRITTVNGTDTFDAGTINILYE